MAAGMGAAAAIMIVCENRTGRGGRGGNRSATRMAGQLRGDGGPGGGVLPAPRNAADVPGDDRGDADVARANCWTLAEALGHGGPHRLQHFLARAVWDHDGVRDRAARWVAYQLADDQAVLV